MKVRCPRSLETVGASRPGAVPFHQLAMGSKIELEGTVGQRPRLVPKVPGAL